MGPRFVLACWMITVSVSCGLSDLRELSLAECSDGLDNDGDGQADCADPDCQVYECCRSGEDARCSVAELQFDASLGTAWLSPTPRPSEQEVPDASLMTAPDATDDPPPPPPPSQSPTLDASTPAAPASSDPCAEDPSECPPPQCPQAGCPQEMEPPNWRITAIGVDVPKQTSYTLDNEKDCVDPDSQCSVPIRLPPFVLCGCSPDPWVNVMVDGEEVGRTDSEVNVLSARWTVDIELRLTSDTELRFDVMDRDVTTDELIYTCAVPQDARAEQLPLGIVSCEQSFTTDTGRRPFAVSAEMVPIAPDAQ